MTGLPNENRKRDEPKAVFGTMALEFRSAVCYVLILILVWAILFKYDWWFCKGETRVYALTEKPDDIPVVAKGFWINELLTMAPARVDPAVISDAPAIPDWLNLFEGELYWLSGNFIP